MTERLFNKAYNDRIRDSSFTMKERRFRLDIRNTFL